MMTTAKVYLAEFEKIAQDIIDKSTGSPDGLKVITLKNDCRVVYSAHQLMVLLECGQRTWSFNAEDPAWPELVLEKVRS